MGSTVLRIILVDQYQERDGEEDRKTDREIHVKDIWKCWVKGGGRTGENIIIKWKNDILYHCGDPS